MQRNMDLVRAILLHAEEQSAQQTLINFSSDTPLAVEADYDTIRNHLLLLENGGLVSGVHQSNTGTHIEAITWKGHDFLDASRSPTIWAQAKQKLKEVGGTASMAVMLQLLQMLVRQKLGLSE